MSWYRTDARLPRQARAANTAHRLRTQRATTQDAFHRLFPTLRSGELPTPVFYHLRVPAVRTPSSLSDVEPASSQAWERLAQLVTPSVRHVGLTPRSAASPDVLWRFLQPTGCHEYPQASRFPSGVLAHFRSPLDPSPRYARACARRTRRAPLRRQGSVAGNLTPGDATVGRRGNQLRS